MSELFRVDTYPDVLGSISRGLRSDLDSLQVALGVFPRQAFLNQPLEIVLLLQSMVDQPIQVKVKVQVPPDDSRGSVLVLDTPKNEVTATLKGGEVGALRIPIIAYPPTQPGTDIPLHVAIRHKTGRGAKPVRSRAGGVPPTSFAVSSFKLQALRDVTFTAQPLNGDPSTLTTYFDIAPKRLDMAQYTLVPRYETLWTKAEMAGEHEMVQSQVELAQQIASSMTTTAIYWSVYYATEEKWARRGVQLGAGELKALTKIMTYTLSDATLNERSYSLGTSRWFQTLCYALLAEPDTLPHLDPGEIAAEYLYDTAVFDAITLGFRIISSRSTVKLGTESEQQAYAEKLVSWLGGHGPADLSYLYLPLVLAGIAVNVLVGATTENPWIMLDELREDAKVRQASAGKGAREIFEMLDTFLDNGEFELTRMNYSRPEPE